MSRKSFGTQGDEAFHEGDFERALDLYSLSLDNEESKDDDNKFSLLSNLSACHLKIAQEEKSSDISIKHRKLALETAENCISCSPLKPNVYLLIHFMVYFYYELVNYDS